MTKEIFDRLSKYELALHRALKVNFVHLAQGEFNELMMIYTQLFGKSLNRSQMNCSSCRLTAMKALATEYFKAKAEMPKIATIEDEEKPKRGRPKKIEKFFEKILGNGESENKEE